MSTLRSQVAVLREALRTMRQAANSGVRFCDFIDGKPSEAFVSSLGKGGAYVLMPKPCSPEQWEAEAQHQQAGLQRRANVFYKDGYVPGEG